MEVLRVISAIQCLVTLSMAKMADGYARIIGIRTVMLQSYGAQG